MCPHIPNEALGPRARGSQEVFPHPVGTPPWEPRARGARSYQAIEKKAMLAGAQAAQAVADTTAAAAAHGSEMCD